VSGPSLADRAVQLGLRCYPSWWRERYGAEQEALVEDLRADHGGGPSIGRSGWRFAFSFVVGAVRARVTGAGMPAVPGLWKLRAQAAMVVAGLSAAVALPLAVLVIPRTCERISPAMGRTGSSVQLSIAGRIAYWDVVVLVLLILACLVQLVAAAVGLSRQVFGAESPGRRVLVAVIAGTPAVAIGGGAAMLKLSVSLRPVVSSWEKVRGHTVHVWYSDRGHPAAAALLHWAGWVGIVGGWVAGMVVLAWMATRHPLPLRSLADAVLRTRALAYLQIAIVLSVVVLAATVPFQRAEGAGLLYSTDLGAWAPVTFSALGGAVALTWAATRAARRALGRALPAISP